MSDMIIFKDILIPEKVISIHDPSALLFTPIKVNVGTINKKYGYINMDVRNHLVWDYEKGRGVPLDIQADMRQMPFKNETVDEIFSGESLEHIYTNEVVPTLKEFFRVLKLNGKIRVDTIDLLACCNQFMEKEEDRVHLINLFYGGQSFEEDTHKTGFFSPYIENLFVSVGFRDVKRIENTGYLTIEAYK